MKQSLDKSEERDRRNRGGIETCSEESKVNLILTKSVNEGSRRRGM